MIPIADIELIEEIESDDDRAWSNSVTVIVIAGVVVLVGVFLAGLASLGSS